MVDSFRISKSLTLEIGYNTNVFDWTFVTNAAEAFALAAEKLLYQSDLGGQIFFITNDDPRPLWDIPNAIYAGVEPHSRCYITCIPTWMALVAAGIGKGGDARLLFQAFARQCSASQSFNIEKAKSMLGYKPTVSLDEGVERTIRVSTDYQNVYRDLIFGTSCSTGWIVRHPTWSHGQSYSRLDQSRRSSKNMFLVPLYD